MVGWECVFALTFDVSLCEERGEKGEVGRVGIAGMPGLPGTPVSVNAFPFLHPQIPEK